MIPKRLGMVALAGIADEVQAITEGISPFSHGNPVASCLLFEDGESFFLAYLKGKMSWLLTR